LAAAACPSYKRSVAEQRAAAAFERLRAELYALLARYDLEAALAADWLEGPWSAIWPLIERMGQVKQEHPAFLEDARRLRDAALSEIEALAVAETRGAG
jgi:hypothetical protein